MTVVNCFNRKCPHNKSGICTLESIDLDGDDYNMWCNSVPDMAVTA